MCACVVSVMPTLGYRAVWAMGERVGYGKTEFSFRVRAAVAIDLLWGMARVRASRCKLYMP